MAVQVVVVGALPVLSPAVRNPELPAKNKLVIFCNESMYVLALHDIQPRCLLLLLLIDPEAPAVLPRILHA